MAEGSIPTMRSTRNPAAYRITSSGSGSRGIPNRTAHSRGLRIDGARLDVRTAIRRVQRLQPSAALRCERRGRQHIDSSTFRSIIKRRAAADLPGRGEGAPLMNGFVFPLQLALAPLVGCRHRRRTSVEPSDGRSSDERARLERSGDVRARDAIDNRADRQHL